jgi:hypothetical protein
MTKTLSRLLRKEQMAFLGRDRAGWASHLERVRSFLGQGLQAADPSRPVLILGAGSGLEVPWGLTPRGTTGWDADPWSRVWTALRHHRWPPWVFEDLTGGLEALEHLVRRSVAEPWSKRRRDPETSRKRLAGLLPSLNPQPVALKAWVAAHRPGTILCANVMGQFGVVAERLVETAFGEDPWEPDPERPDGLAEALDDWTRRAVAAFLGALAESGADLWLVHDRAVLFGSLEVALGPWEDDWTGQLQGAARVEGSDPLLGQSVTQVLAERAGRFLHQERWLWPVAPGQRHVVEALAWQHDPP